MVVRTSSTVWCRLITRVRARGAWPKTVAASVPTGCGSRNQVVKLAIPFWAMRPIQDRSSADSSRYHARSRSIRAVVAVASGPTDFSSRRASALRERVATLPR
jgi:hypothetical protein